MHLGKKRNIEVLDTIEFLHRVCMHIPDHYESLIRYYGFYSNADRPIEYPKPPPENSFLYTDLLSKLAA